MGNKVLKKIAKNLFVILFLVNGTVMFSQSKKEIKKNKIKAMMVVDVKNEQTITDRKTIFNKNGQTLEEAEYDKKGNIKKTMKYKYNKKGDEIEQEEYNNANKLVKKKITKYNSFNEKLEEETYDGNGVLQKTEIYVYDSKGLKIERKTKSPDGTITEVRKYMYTY